MGACCKGSHQANGYWDFKIDGSLTARKIRMVDPKHLSC